MAVSDFIDDLCNDRDLPRLLEAARSGQPIELERLAAIAYGAADRVTVARCGDHWLRALLDYAERARIGTLTQDDVTGEVVLVPAEPLPTLEQARAAIASTWPPLPERDG